MPTSPVLTRMFALLPLLAGLSALAQTAPKPHAAASYGKVPLHFEANQGQAEASAKFVAHGPGYSIQLQPTSATILLHHSTAKPGIHNLSVPEQVQTVRMTMLGADAAAAISAQQPSSTYVNYMTGPFHKDWKLGVPTFLETRTTGLYPGIDVVYHGNQRALEYDFVVAPGADASKIHMAVTGAKASLAQDGSLHLGTGLSFGKPVLYQQAGGQRQLVDGAFTLAANGEIGFQTGAYDHSRELVIDPIISYASYFGGAAEDEINGSALNSAGQLYAVGQTFSAALPGTAGEFETGSAANNNGHDAFVTKFSADGSTILWTTYLSGSADDFATGVAVNAADQAYVVGYTNSCGSNGTSYVTPGEFPFVGGVQALCNAQVIGFNNYETNGGGYDAFLVKLSSDGKSELYGTPLGGTANDIASSVALDASGKVYIVGETSSTGYIYSSNVQRTADVPSYPVNLHGAAAIGVANYPTTNSAFYTNITESKNNSYLCQNSLGNCPDAPDGSMHGPQDEQAFLTVLSADLSTIVYSSLLGGPVLGGAGNGTSATNGIAIAVNANGIAYIGGNTSSAHWPVTANAFASTCANAGAANSTCNLTGWLAAFDATKSGAASLLFNTYVTGQTAGKSSSGTTLAPTGDVFGLTTDASGNVIATGDTSSVDFPTTAGTLQPSCFKFGDGNGDTGVCEFEAFVTKVSPSGAIVWSTYLGATQQDIAPTIGRGVAIDSNSNVYLLATTGTSYLPTRNPIAATPGSGSDAYVAELSSTGTSVLMGTYLGTGGGISLNNNSLAIDSNATVYFSGSQAPNTYGGTYFPISANAADRTIQGSDGFVVKLITQQQASATALTVLPTGTVTPTQTVTLTVNVSTPSKLTGTLLPTGTVTFLNGTATVGTAKLAAGVATFTGTLAAGSYSITASYPGDAAFAASVSSATPLTVSSSLATTTTETVAPATSAYGTPEVLTATVLAGTAPATSGSVTFTAGTLTLGTAMINAQGTASVTVTPAVGMYSVVASYAGTYNANTNPNGYNASTSAGATLTISKATSTTLLSTPSNVIGSGVNFTITATVPTAATGSVAFSYNSVGIGTATVANGVATITTTINTPGSYNLTAVYSGDANFSGSTSSAVPVIVAVPGYSVTANPASLTIARGATGTTTLTFTPAGGFTGTLALACSGLPAKATCSFSPASVTLAGTPVSSTLTIGTGSLAALVMPEFPSRKANALKTSMAILLPGSLLAFGLWRRRKLTVRMPWLALLALAALGSLAGCAGGNFGANATQTGAYSITVTVTGATGSAQSVPLSVTVQ